MNKKPFDYNGSDYYRESFKGEDTDYFQWVRITPYTPTEKSIMRKQKLNNKKTAIRININSTDTPEQIADKMTKRFQKK